MFLPCFFSSRTFSRTFFVKWCGLFPFWDLTGKLHKWSTLALFKTFWVSLLQLLFSGDLLNFLTLSWMSFLELLKDVKVPKICHTYPTTMKFGTVVIPYLNEDPKIYKSPDASLELSWHHHFFIPEISNFCFVRKCRWNLHFYTYSLILLTFWVLSCFNYMIATFMMPSKLDTPGLLKITVCWKKDYNVMISFSHILYCGCGQMSKIW